MIWVGTCGFGSRQMEVFRSLDVVEVQETFYRPLSPDLARKWRIRAPSDFRFAVKASQFITHEASSPTYRRSGRLIPQADRRAYGSFQDTAQVREGWEATRVIAEALAAPVIVFQCPASFGPTEEHVAAMYRFFETIRTPAVKAWEPRGPWPSHLIEKLCEDLGLVHVADPFAREPVTAGLAYFRLHGSPPGRTLYRYSYTPDDLVRLEAWCREFDDAYVLFNNLAMHADANRFRATLGGSRKE